MALDGAGGLDMANMATDRLADTIGFSTFSAPGTQPDPGLAWYAPGTVNPALAGSQREPVPFGFDDPDLEPRELA